MKPSQEEVNKTIKKVLAEAKKKKEKEQQLKHKAKPEAYGYAEAFDFSAPLGAYNLYRSQGPVNWGPMTGPGTKIDDRIAGQRADIESLTRDIVKESLGKSSWESLNESANVDEASATWNALKKGVGSFLKGAGKTAVDAAKGMGSSVASAAKDASSEFSATREKNKAEKERKSQEKQAAKTASNAASSKVSIAKNARDYFKKTSQMADTLTKSKKSVPSDEELNISLDNAITSLEDANDKLGNVARVADTDESEEGRLATVAK